MTLRERLPIDERRAQLLAVGLKMFAERPYDDIAVEDVASQVGISKGLLYHYFPSKRHFYVETLRAAAAEMVKLTAPSPAPPSVDELRAGLEVYLDYIYRNAAGYRALMRSGVGSDAEVLAIVEGVRQVMIDRIVHALGMAQPSPVVRVALRGWIGFVEGASLDWLEHQDMARDHLCQLLVESLVNALTVAGRCHPQ
jgi:AcrR family transcriptional regulator